jgi:hypothetical protein
MRTLLLASLLFATACIDERDDLIGSYRTTLTMTIVRDDGSTRAFASPDVSVLVSPNGDDNAVSLSAHANNGASIDCGIYMVAIDDMLVKDTNYNGWGDIRICDELRTDCWHVDTEAATATVVGEQFTLTTTGAARHSTAIDDGTATATLSGQRTY